MKKVINGKLYNTETAKLQGEWDNGSLPGNLEYCYEDLYLTKSGNFFLHGGGGPLSKYGRWVGNDQCGSQEIIPMTWEAARSWAEDHLTADEYIKIFGAEDDSDGEGVEKFTMTFPAGIGRRIRKEAARMGVTPAEYITSVLEKVF